MNVGVRVNVINLAFRVPRSTCSCTDPYKCTVKFQVIPSIVNIFLLPHLKYSGAVAYVSSFYNPLNYLHQRTIFLFPPLARMSTCRTALNSIFPFKF